MGLGKTLQAIALILKYRQEGVKKPVVNRWPDSGKQLSLFDAPEEVSRPDEGDRSLVYHTCLVVVPASLIHNWRNELRKFAPQLTVTIYAGTNRIDLRSYLQRSDVVLITYHTLRNDIDILSRLTFGIVVADEAQMLKNPGSQLHQAMMRIQVFLGFVGYTDRKFTDRFVGCDELGEPGITRITAFFPRSFYPSYIGRCRRADERSFA